MNQHQVHYVHNYSVNEQLLEQLLHLDLINFIQIFIICTIENVKKKQLFLFNKKQHSNFSSKMFYLSVKNDILRDYLHFSIILKYLPIHLTQFKTMALTRLCFLSMCFDDFSVYCIYLLFEYDLKINCKQQILSSSNNQTNSCI